MKVEHRGKQEEEEDGEDKKKQEDEHEMKGGTEQDQLNRGENMDDDSVVLKNIGTRQVVNQRPFKTNFPSVGLLPSVR